MTSAILTTTEDEVVRLYLQGYTKKEIAKIRHRSPGTIQRELQDTYQKAGVTNGIQLFTWYFRESLKIDLIKFLNQ